MEAVFYLVPSLMLAIAAGAAFTLIRRARRINQAWTSGLSAQARCLRVYSTTRGGLGEDHRMRTTLHHVYEFTAQDGRTVRFEEENGPGTVIEGDLVTVRYTPGHPEQATAKPPQQGRLLAESGCFLAFLGVFAAACVAFMAAAHTMLGLMDL